MIDLEGLDLATLRSRRSEKWGRYPVDVLPAWVAELDFPVAPAIQHALQETLDRHDFGYPLEPQETGLPAVFAARMEQRYGWQLAAERVELLADVVQGVYLATTQYTAPGDGVVVQTPIYPPFLAALRETGRRLVENPLRRGADRYELDLAGLRQGSDGGTRLILLCNPHNPTGRVFSRSELGALAEIAIERDWVVVSDEIHADLVYPGTRHIPFASLSREAAARTVTLSSATKAFNIPGLRCAVAAFGSPALQERFNAVPRHQRGGVGGVGVSATLAAWREGQPWLDAVLAYLEGNRAWVDDFVAGELPGVESAAPEAGYLAWLDCRAAALSPSAQRFFLDRGRVALSPGEAFGRPGRGFVRLNFGTTRSLLTEILDRMRRALGGRR